MLPRLYENTKDHEFRLKKAINIIRDNKMNINEEKYIYRAKVLFLGRIIEKEESHCTWCFD